MHDNKVRTGTLFTTQRLNQITDGVFAVAMTLLVLGIVIPEVTTGNAQMELAKRINELGPKFYSYALGFLILGNMWIMHRYQFRHIRQVDNGLSWLNIGFLVFISFVPFTISLLGDYLHEGTATIMVGINWLAFMGLQMGMWAYAARNRDLVESDIDMDFARPWIRAGAIVCVIIGIIMGISFVNATAANISFIGMLIFYVVTTARHRLPWQKANERW